MKYGFRMMIAAVLIAGIAFSSCRKKKKEDPKPDYANGISDGTYTVEDEDIEETVNITGGNLIIAGESTVSSDINMKQEGGSLQIHDSVEVHKINMHGGDVSLTGSPTIKTDFNQNAGTVYIGDCHSTLYDTVTIKVNYNIDDTLYVLGGVLVIEHDLNQNRGFIDVEDGAKIIVRNHFNLGGTVYGMRNITSKVLNENKHDSIQQAPIGRDKCK